MCIRDRKYLGLKVEHREVLFDEVKDFAECGLCGTAAVSYTHLDVYKRQEQGCE